MKVTLVMVISVDGKTTKWGNPDIHTWTSREDQSHFSSILKKHKLMIVGRKTFEIYKSALQLLDKKHCVVITKHPKNYINTKHIQFANKNPRLLIKQLEDNGFTNALLMGGSQINTIFFQRRLVSEILLTIEPCIFGIGTQLNMEKKLNINLVLANVRKLNRKGTLLLKYKVIY